MMGRVKYFVYALSLKESYMITTQMCVTKAKPGEVPNVMIRARFWVSRRLRLKTRNVHK